MNADERERLAQRKPEEIMAEANAKDDWRGTCECGLVRVGTVAELLQKCPQCGK